MILPIAFCLLSDFASLQSLVSIQATEIMQCQIHFHGDASSIVLQASTGPFILPPLVWYEYLIQTVEDHATAARHSPVRIPRTRTGRTIPPQLVDENWQAK
jgi:hypothetical protein